jgi:hypothetical protein
VDTPGRSITDTADVLVAAGQLSGLIGGFTLLFEIFLMSRVGWLERSVGAHRLLVWHRELGGFLLVVILAHMALTIVGDRSTGLQSDSDADQPKRRRRRRHHLHRWGGLAQRLRRQRRPVADGAAVRSRYRGLHPAGRGGRGNLTALRRLL